MGKEGRNLVLRIFLLLAFLLPGVVMAQENTSWIDDLLDDLSDFVPVLFDVDIYEGSTNREDEILVIPENEESANIQAGSFLVEESEKDSDDRFNSAIQSKSTGGFWHITDTWEGGVVPDVDDYVVITGDRVTSTENISIAGMLVEEGAIYDVGNSSSFGDKTVQVGILENHGTINYSRNAFLETKSELQNTGSITVPIIWSGGRDGVFESGQRIFSNFILGADLLLDSDIFIDDFESNGFTIWSNFDSEIIIGEYDEIVVAGPSILRVGPTTGSRNYDGNVAAPDSDLYLKTGQYSASFVAENIYLSGDGDYRIIADTEFEGNTTIGEDAGVYYYHRYGFTRDVYFSGSVINNGNVYGNLNIGLTADVINNDRWTAQNTFFIGPDDSDSYVIHIGDIGDGQSEGNLGAESKTPNQSSLISAGNKRIISFLDNGAETGVEYLINTEPDDYRDPYDFDDSIYFSVIDDQISGQPFDISIRSDKDVGQVVYLHSNSGYVYPRRVELENGEWEGDVTVFGSDSNNRLFVNQGDYLGESNTFAVNESMISQNGSVQGRVYDATLGGDRQYIAEQTVYLYEHDPRESLGDVLVATTESDEDGWYQFDSVVCGDHYISAEPEDSPYRTIEPVDVSCGSQVVHDIGSVQCSPNDKIPVLILPGIMGSTVNELRFSVYPELTKHRPSWREQELQIHDLSQLEVLQQDLGFNQLSDNLVSEGYVFGCDVFHVSYDWSLPVYESAQHYLKPWIEKAKTMSGQSRVDIVAHSMGGLVTRSYLQGPDYDNDVRKFVMVGTPNYGSVDSYPAWAGGDPIAADSLRQSWIPIAEDFQTRSIDLNYQIRTGDESVCLYQDDLLINRLLPIPTVFKNEPLGCDNQRIYGFLHNQGQALGHLIPTYDSPLYGDGDEIVYEENKFLKALNGQSCFSGDCGYKDLVVRTISDVAGQVDIKIFYGEESGEDETVSQLKVFESTGDFYRDGKFVKNGEARRDFGDGTVPTSSALIAEIDSKKIVEVLHKNLVRISIDAIINFIYE